MALIAWRKGPTYFCAFTCLNNFCHAQNNTPALLSSAMKNVISCSQLLGLHVFDGHHPGCFLAGFPFRIQRHFCLGAGQESWSAFWAVGGVADPLGKKGSFIEAAYSRITNNFVLHPFYFFE